MEAGRLNSGWSRHLVQKAAGCWGGKDEMTDEDGEYCMHKS